MMRARFLLAGLAVAGALLAGSAIALGQARSADSTSTNPRTGVVVVTTNLAFEHGAGAGTGIVLSSNEVLTNNHVIRGATSVRVTDPASHRTYSATVVGYSVSKDVALLRLSHAQGLKTASIGSSSSLGVGDAVTAVGNAGGNGLTVTRGTLTGLHRSITVSDGQGSSSRLTDLLATSARLVPGDSGGPLLSHGRVIGVDAATTGGFDFEGGGEGYAIPINTAVSVIKQIDAGKRSSTVHIGATAFIGVSLGQSDAYGQPSGAVVEGVVPGSPAEKAGLVPGDLITRFDGRRVSSPDGLRKLVLQLSPGTAARLAWIDEAGYGHSATVRVVSGPPQ